MDSYLMFTAIDQPVTACKYCNIFIRLTGITRHFDFEVLFLWGCFWLDPHKVKFSYDWYMLQYLLVQFMSAVCWFERVLLFRLFSPSSLPLRFLQFVSVCCCAKCWLLHHLYCWWILLPGINIAWPTFQAALVFMMPLHQRFWPFH